MASSFIIEPSNNAEEESVLQPGGKGMKLSSLSYASYSKMLGSQVKPGY
jgi:hypothetical protein